MDKQQFFQELKLNPNRMFVVFAPIGISFSDNDWLAIDMMQEICDELDIQLHVRFPPNDFVDEKELAKRPTLNYLYPGIRYGTKRGGDWDMTEKDSEILKNTLAYMEVLVAYATSLVIDAAIMDKLVININFNLKIPEDMAHDPLMYYKYEHYKKALSTGGIKLVNTREELVEALQLYLRKSRLLKELFWKI